MIDSQALVYHGGAAAAARLNETAELAQKGAGSEAKFGRLGGSGWRTLAPREARAAVPDGGGSPEFWDESHGFLCIFNTSVKESIMIRRQPAPTPQFIKKDCTPRKASKALVCYLDSQKDFFTPSLFYIFFVNLFS